MIFYRDSDETSANDIVCKTADGEEFTVGWVEQTGDHYYVLCMWMTNLDDSRNHLSPTTYPEEAQFKTYDEAYDALIEAAVIAVIGGFRGR